MKILRHFPIWIFPTLSGMALTFHFFFIWMFQHGDSYYYLAFMQFLKTGIYPFQHPFIYQKPTTIAAPLYSFLLLPLSYLTRADIWLHLTQLLMLVGTAYLLFLILKLIINLPRRQAGQQLSIVIASLFIFIPANFIFASYVMTEIPALFCHTVFMYVLLKFLKTSKIQYLSVLLLFTSLMTLLKYQFILLFGISGILFGWTLIRKLYWKIIPSLILPLIGITILVTWIIYNHQITGVWGLSDTTKIRFHASYVYYGGHFPKESDPAVQKLREFIPWDMDPHSAWWDVQYFIIKKIGNNWHDIDEIVGNVGLAAVREDPIGFVINAGKIFSTMHTMNTKAPWWNNITLFGDTNPESKAWLNCNPYGTFAFCQPLIMTASSYHLWNSFVNWAYGNYVTLFPLFSLYMLFPALLINLLNRDKIGRLLSLLYLGELFVASFSITPEPRYLYPYYPMMIIIVISAGVKMYSFLKTLYAKVIFSRNK